MMVFRALRLTIFTLFISACSNEIRFSTKIPVNAMSNAYVHGCVSGWWLWPKAPNSMLHHVRQVDNKDGDFFAFKEGIEGRGRYVSLVMSAAHGKGTLVVMRSQMKNPVEISIPTSVVSQWNERLSAFTRIRDQLAYGQTEFVSHVPCRFVIGRKNGIVTRLIAIGVFDSSSTFDFIHDIRTYAYRLTDNGEFVDTATQIDPPYYHEVMDLQWKIRDEIFFEIEHWMR